MTLSSLPGIKGSASAIGSKPRWKNREKTRIIKLSKPGVSLEFLGHSFRYEPDRYGRAKRFLNRVPSAKACAREREKLRGMISAKQAFVPTPKLVARANRQVRGWANYFEHGRSRPAFRALNWFLQKRMVQHLKRWSQCPFRPPKG